MVVETTECRSKDIAHLMSVSDRQIRNWKEKGLPRNADGSYDLRAVVQWRIDQINEAADAAKTSGKSEALEEYRKHRAAQEKIRLEEMRREYIRRDVLRHGFGVVAGIIRRAGETLQRRFGPDAAEIMETALDEAEARVVEVLGAAAIEDATGQLPESED